MRSISDHISARSHLCKRGTRDATNVLCCLTVPGYYIRDVSGLGDFRSNLRHTQSNRDF